MDENSYLLDYDIESVEPNPPRGEDEPLDGLSVYEEKFPLTTKEGPHHFISPHHHQSRSEKNDLRPLDTKYHPSHLPYVINPTIW